MERTSRPQAAPRLPGVSSHNVCSGVAAQSTVIHKNTGSAAKAIAPEKNNPAGHAGEPWIHRPLEALHFRVFARDVLRGKASAESLPDRLARFAPSLVRGDFVPTMAQGYADVLAILNDEHDGREAEKKQLTLPFMARTAGHIRIRVFVQQFNETKNQWEECL